MQITLQKQKSLTMLTSKVFDGFETLDEYTA